MWESNGELSDIVGYFLQPMDFFFDIEQRVAGKVVGPERGQGVCADFSG